MNVVQVIYVGTGVITFLALIFIVLCIWASRTIISFKKYAGTRDKMYLDRISAIEMLIKNEFVEVIKSITKLTIK